MGILNVTPDSFSDGGRYLDPGPAIEQGLRMVDEGADFIDIGGESSRPGASRVSESEELDRVTPVLRALVAQCGVPISIDTQKTRVARRCIDAGAAIINDIGGLRDPAMAEVAADTGTSVVIMHMRGTPATMQQYTRYDDVVAEIRGFLEAAASAATRAGVPEIAIDPGLGFGKTAGQNFEILARLNEIETLGYPVLVGPSRKSFLGSLPSRLPTEERLEGTLAAVAAGALNGARIVRVHDVEPCRRVLDVVDAVRGGRSMRDKMLIPGIPLRARVGCTEAERKARQTVMVDIELRCDVDPGASEDSIASAIDYVCVREEAARVVSARPYNLIETIGVRIATRLLERFPAAEVLVRVRKPSALKEFGVPWAGVEVVRSRRG